MLNHDYKIKNLRLDHNYEPKSQQLSHYVDF